MNSRQEMENIKHWTTFCERC